MEIAAINEQLTAHEPDQMVLRGISGNGNTLTLAFLCDGGPAEDLEFVVTFENPAVFHLPRILHNTAVRFKPSSPERIKKLIPAVSYDESEHDPNGYVVVELTDAAQQPYGYYVMADRVVGRWEPLRNVVQAP
jgi:hypothetical protein